MIYNPKPNLLIPDNVDLYEEQIKAGVNDLFPYNRLMIIYRKQKEYKEELRVINKALAVFKKQLSDQQKTSFAKKKNKKSYRNLAWLSAK